MALTVRMNTGYAVVSQKKKAIKYFPDCLLFLCGTFRLLLYYSSIPWLGCCILNQELKKNSLNCGYVSRTASGICGVFPGIRGLMD